MIQLADEQKKAVESIVGRTVVIAGPGSGKTRVAIERIALMIEARASGAGASADEFCVVTFSNRAAAELQERLEERGVTGLGFVGTIHGLAWRILEMANALDQGLRDGFTIWDQIDRDAAVSKVRADGHFRSSQKRAVEYIAAHHASRDALVGLPESEDRKERDLIEIAARYERMKQRANVEDFDGLVARAARVLLANPQLAIDLRSKWRHLVVDEYQDVSPAQDEFLHLLATRGHGRSSFLVGDPHQTLYRFRGADPDLLTDRGEQADRLVYLHTNYRSTPTIIDHACSLAECDPLGSPNIHPENETPNGQPVETFSAFGEEEEALGIAHRIADLMGVLDPIARLPGIAILASTHKRLACFADALSRVGIDHHQLATAGSVLKTPIARIGRARLRLTVNPGDVLAEELLGDLPALDSGHDDTIADRLALWLGRYAVEQEVESFSDGSEFVDALTGWQQTTPAAGRNPRELLRWLGTARLEDRPADDKSSVTLGTFHAAKGLEWPVVFVVGLSDEWVPGFAANKPEQLVDSRRALYVAVTRAQDQLFVSWSQNGRPTSWAQRSEALKPSRFLAEMCIETE